MRRKLQISPDTVLQQAKATQPDRFVWVSANAGSGKTTVLVRRMLRLMLTGVEPSRILCLTFTEAAAANMKNRLFEQLAKWAVASETDLSAGIIATTGANSASGQERSIARKLFATALQSPGGLKISTIHGFCTSILQIAPIEANVPARFEVADETYAKTLMREARDQVLSQTIEGSEDQVLLGSIRRVIQEANSDQFDALMASMSGRAEAFTDASGVPIPEAEYRFWLAKALGVPSDISPLAVLDHALEQLPPRSQLPEWIALLQKSSSNDKAQAERLRSVSDVNDARAQFEKWVSIVLTGEGGARKSMVTAAFAKAHPHINEALMDALGVIETTSDRLKAADTFERNAALYDVTRAILMSYTQAKARRCVLDYADLISHTRNLLARVSPGWVLYKLDASIDHLLVDEAQDTNPAQWSILDALTDEFTSGEGARDKAAMPRTVFSVGDEKQSIFRFQGAEPAAFEQSRRRYMQRTADAHLAFETIRLEQSFRSAREIITFIDAVFGSEVRWQGLSAEPQIRPQRHQTARGEDPGTVDLWPLDVDDPMEERQAWDEPVDAPSSGENRLATRIATILKKWTVDRQDDLGRSFDPGHVLILLRKRKTLFEAIIRALKQAGVPVAGTDRLQVQTHIATQDMLAIGQAALLQQDDLTLASALKSPIFGLDDEALLRLAPEREGSLAQALTASTDPVIARAAKLFMRIQHQARRHGPFEFYSWLLGIEGGRRAMVARLGSEANDVLDAWLTAALDYETRHSPSLSQFLNHIQKSEQTIKRDMAIAMGEVRVMTVHGAKGLEAPIVIIPDAGVFNPNSPARFMSDIEVAGPGSSAIKVPIWSPRKELHCERFVAAKAHDATKDGEEHNRLLYVALSRAEERLILAGASKNGTVQEHSWRSALEATFAELDAQTEHVETQSYGGDIGLPDFEFRRYRITPSAPFAADVNAQSMAKPTIPSPGWLMRPMPNVVSLNPPIAPSSALASADSPDRPGDREFDPVAARRGQFVHLLLQHLPQVPSHDQRDTALRLARMFAGSMAETLVSELVDEVLALVGNARFQSLFGSESLPEIEIAGHIVQAGSSHQVQGRIDRLAILGDRILVADYKTARRVPASADEIPIEQLMQMAVYCALLETIIPGKPVHASLIYTSGPAIFELGPKRLDKAMKMLEKTAKKTHQEIT
jgi:ATP-dependent helicase/nuclease subunit A